MLGHLQSINSFKIVKWILYYFAPLVFTN